MHKFITDRIREYADRYVKTYNSKNADHIAECFSIHAPRIAMAILGEFKELDEMIAQAKASNAAALKELGIAPDAFSHAGRVHARGNDFYLPDEFNAG